MAPEDQEASGGVPTGELGQVSEMLRSIPDHPHRFDGEVIMPLLTDDNAWLRGEAERVTLSVIDRAPERVITDIGRLTDILENDPDHISELVRVLAEVIDVTEQHLGADTVDMLASRLQRSEDDDERRQICLLIGNGVTARGAEALLRTADLDVRLAEIAISELKQMVGRAVADLGGSQRRWEGTEAVLLRVARELPSTLDRHLPALFDALGSSDCDVVGILDRYHRRSDSPAEDVPIVAWEILDTADGEGEHSRASAALELVIGTGTLEVGLPRLIDRYSDTLETSGVTSELRHALDQLTSIAQANAEPVVELLATVGQVARGASGHELRESLRRVALACVDDGDRPAIEVLAEVVDRLEGRSAVETLGSHLGILRTRSGGVGHPLEPDEAGAMILGGLRERLSATAETELLLPLHRPRLLAAIILEAALHPSVESQLVLLDVVRGEWGAKKDIRTLLGECELVLGDQVDRSVRASDAIDELHVQIDGQLSGPDEPRGAEVTFVRDLDELETIDTGRFDHVLLFHVDRVGDGVVEATDGLDLQTSTAVTGVYSVMTRHESGLVSWYGPPDVGDPTLVRPNRPQLLAAASVSDDDSGPPRGLHARFGPLHDGLRATITLQGVDSADMGLEFQGIYDIAIKLKHAGIGEAASTLFNSAFMFERLPLPADTFDGIRLDQVRAGERFVAWSTEMYIDRVDRLAGTIDDMRAPLLLMEARDRLGALRDSVAEHSPMYEAVRFQAIEALEQDEQVMVLVGRRSWAPIVRRALMVDLADELDSSAGELTVCGPRDARHAGEVDRVVIPGPLPPWLMGFHVHLRTPRIIVLMYDLRWEVTIREHLDGYIDELRSVLGVLPEDDLIGASVTSDDAALPEPPVAAASEAAPAPNGDPSVMSELERLFARSRPSRETRGTGDYAHERYEVLTSDGQVIDIGGGMQLVIDGSRGYAWIHAAAISQNDRLVTFERDTIDELWSKHLDEYHSDSGGRVLDLIDLWYRSVLDLLRETAERWSLALGGSEHLRRLTREVQSAGCLREPSTIRSWLNAVLRADNAADLIRDPSYVIGPRSADDVRILLSLSTAGLDIDAAKVSRAMKTIRAAHRQQGDEFRDRRLAYVEGAPDPRTLDGVDVITVEQITKSGVDEDGLDD